MISDLQNLISRPKIQHPNSKIKKKNKIQKHQIQTPKSPTKRHRASSLQKKHTTSLPNSDPQHHKIPSIPKNSQQSDCHKGQNYPRGTGTKRQFFCWHKIRPYKLDFNYKLRLAHGHRFLQKCLYKQHCSEHKGPLSVGQISTPIFSGANLPIDCLWLLNSIEKNISLTLHGKGFFGKTRVFGKTWVFSWNPGFVGQTSG